MFKKYFLLLFVCIIPLWSIAQNETALELIAQQLEKGDSLYFGGEREKSEVYYVRVDSLYNQVFEAVKASRNYEEIKGIGKTYADYMRRYRSQYLETIRISKDVLQAAAKTSDTLAMVDAYYEIGASNFKLDNTVAAVENFDTGISLLDKDQYPLRAWKLFRFMAEALKFVDEDSALSNIRKATTYLKDDMPDSFKALNYELYVFLLPDSQLDSIEHYASLQYKYMDKKQKFDILTFSNLLAYRYVKQNQPQKAKQLIEDKLQWCQFEKGVSKGYENCPSPATFHTMGLIYKNLKEYKKAISYFEFTRKKLLEYNDYSSTLIETSIDLADTYKQIANYKKSTEILMPVKSYMDSLAIVNLKKEIEKIEIRRTLKDREEEIGELKEENIANTLTISKITLYIYLLAFALLLAIGFALYRSFKSKVKVHKLKEKVTLNRLHNLTSVMNPHFLFNCFSTLQYMILNNESLKANEYMTELSGLIRNILSASDSIYIPFDKELMILKAYINLENERLSDKFDVTYEIDLALQELEFSIPSMVVQPYIENAIKHGFSEKGKAHKLRVIFEQKSIDILQCRVIDNGVGRTKAGQLKKHHTEQHLSIATGNVEERLNLISTLQPYKTLVSIIDLEDDKGNPVGTEVIVALPIVNNTQNQKKYA